MNNRIRHFFEPWAQVGAIGELDDVMRRMFSALEGRNFDDSGLTIWQGEHDVVVELSLPGFELDDVDLSIENSVVSITATPKDRTLNEGTVALAVERSIDKIERSVRLPYEIEADKAEATLAHGVLTLKLPRSEAHKPRKIAINAG